MNFATLQALTIPEGSVVQITDASGNILWAVANDVPVSLGVEKITSKTYASETTYENEQFILLNIYPRTKSSVVKVTYGGLTKTLTFSSTSAQKIRFGTFNGRSDDVETPASGTLTIEGGYSAFGIASFNTSKGVTAYYTGIVTIGDFGNMKAIPSKAFYQCYKPTTFTLDNMTSIGAEAFMLYPTSSAGNPTEARTFTLNGIPQTIGKDAFTADLYLKKSETYIYVNDNSWDRWASAGTLPYTVRNSTNMNYDPYANQVYLYINGVRTDEITKVELKECTTISAYAFANFRKLPTITIPSSVSSIGDYAFAVLNSKETSSEGLPNDVGKTIYMQSTTPPTLGTESFPTNTSLSIVVPKGYGDIYKAADGWSGYADYITEAS